MSTITINSFPTTWRRGKDAFHHKTGNPPEWCYMGHAAWEAFEDYLHTLRHYYVPCDPLEDCDAVFEGVKIVRVLRGYHFNFA